MSNRMNWGDMAEEIYQDELKKTQETAQEMAKDASDGFTLVCKKSKKTKTEAYQEVVKNWYDSHGSCERLEKNLKCQDCGTMFFFKNEEEYKKKGKKIPKLCWNCHNKSKS